MAGRTSRMKVLILAVLIVPTAFGLAGWSSAGAQAGSGDSPMFRFGPDHTGYNAAESAIGANNVASVVPKWTATTNGPIESSPAVVNGVVYVTSGATFVNGSITVPASLYAYAADGSTLWSATPGGDMLYGSPTVVDGVVYVGNSSGVLYAYDANGITNCSAITKTCNPLWKSELLGGAIRSAPTVATLVDSAGNPQIDPGTGKVLKYVYVSGVYGQMWAFYAGPTGDPGNCTTYDRHGTLICDWDWQASTPGDVFASPTVATLQQSDGTYKQMVYTSSGSGGDKLWAYEAAGTDSSYCAIAPPHGAHTVTTSRYCNPNWTAALRPGHSTLAVADGVIYSGSEDSMLEAFDANGIANCSGAYPSVACFPLWTGATGRQGGSSPAVANGVVYIGSGFTTSGQGKLYAFTAGANPTGCVVVNGAKTCSPLWTGLTAGIISKSSPTVANGVVYIGSEDSKLYAFPASATSPSCSGTPVACSPLWSYQTSGFVNTATVSNGRVYAGSTDFRLYAFGLP
jgi:outer membrane protein assembly factor BamB